jgi:hypothetical protein
MLIPVARRAITVSATNVGGWSIKEFDTGAGELAPRWEKSFGITDSNVVSVVFGNAIDSLKEQLALKGKDAMTREQRTAVEKVLAILEPRHAMLLLKGIGSFEFEPVEKAPASQPVAKAVVAEPIFPSSVVAPPVVAPVTPAAPTAAAPAPQSASAPEPALN